MTTPTRDCEVRSENKRTLEGCEKDYRVLERYHKEGKYSKKAMMSEKIIIVIKFRGWIANTLYNQYFYLIKISGMTFPK